MLFICIETIDSFQVYVIRSFCATNFLCTVDFNCINLIRHGDLTRSTVNYSRFFVMVRRDWLRTSSCNNGRMNSALASCFILISYVT